MNGLLIVFVIPALALPAPALVSLVVRLFAAPNGKADARTEGEAVACHRVAGSARAQGSQRDHSHHLNFSDLVVRPEILRGQAGRLVAIAAGLSHLLQTLSGGLVCAAPLLLAGLATSCVPLERNTTPLARFEFQQPQMGLPFRIVLYAPNETAATNAAQAGFKRIAQLNDILSDYDTDSELSQLSRTSGEGREVPVSDDLWRVLARAQEVARQSDGAFDVTVGPYVNLWRKARREKKMPDPARLALARESVGYEHVRLNPKRETVQLLAPNMRLDLGGIAKGYAIDEALEVLAQHGIKCALVSGGGDMAVSDPPPGKKGWRIELPPLDVSNAPPARFVLLSHAALATSGDLFQRLEIDGKRYSHIVDPRTGIGLTDHSLVHVIAPDGMTADSLTKVVSVLGPDKGLKIIEGTHDVAAQVARQPAGKIEIRESSRFARYVVEP